MDDKDTGSQNAQPEEPSEELAQVVYEMAEALTALGNYVAAAEQILKNGKTTGGDVRKALEAGLSQHDRASVGLRRLQELAVHLFQSLTQSRIATSHDIERCVVVGHACLTIPARMLRSARQCRACTAPSGAMHEKPVVDLMQDTAALGPLRS
jgi:hypothetical protein